MIEGSLDLENARTAKPSDTLRSSNAEALGRVERRVIDEVEQAASDALESAGANIPKGESAAEGVYAVSQTALDETLAVNALL